LLACCTTLWMGALLSSCTQEEALPKENFPKFNPRISAALQRVSSCEELETQARNAAFLRIQAAYSWRLEYALERLREANSDTCQYGHDGEAVAVEMADDAPKNAPPDAAAGSAADVSGTNNQIAQVDEADIVKADKQHIYVAKGDHLRIFTSWPPETAKELSSVPFDGQAKRLLKVGDRILVISFAVDESSPYASYWYEGNANTLDPYLPYYSKTILTLFDVSDPASPKKLRQSNLKARFETARSIDNNAILVLSQPEPFQIRHYWWPSICDDKKLVSEKKLRASYIRALNKVHEELQNVPARQFGLHIEDSHSGPSWVCNNVFVNGMPDGAEQTSVVRMDLFREAPLESATILSRTGEVFVSENNVYMAVPHNQAPSTPWFEDWDNHTHVSVVHKFALPRENPSPTYAASGVVKGNVLNSFSMDEYKDFLRIATTTPRSWWMNNSRPQESVLSVFRQEGSTLQLHGQLDNIAPTEQIYSARFVGDRAYIVTFLQIDPLFAIDLSDPARPHILGELKIPGFSTYIHPLNENRLLTIGYDADDWGRTQGLQVQLFDISNPRELQRIAALPLDLYGSHGHSEAAHNHLGFAYYPPLQLLALPVAEYSYYGNSGFQGVRLFRVDPSTTEPAKALQAFGNIPHPDLPHSTPYGYYGYGSPVLRNIFMMEKADGSGDNFLYSLSNSALFATQLSSTPQAELLPLRVLLLPP